MRWHSHSPPAPSARALRLLAACSLMHGSVGVATNQHFSISELGWARDGYPSGSIVFVDFRLPNSILWRCWHVSEGMVEKGS